MPDITFSGTGLPIMNFSLDGAPVRRGDYTVYPAARLFRAGDFPDKQITVSREDLAEIASDFAPVNANMEHLKFGALQALDGLLGHIERVWVDPDDSDLLRGEVYVPAWLSERLPDPGLSVELSPEKKLAGFAYTSFPRIQEAALFSAYTEFARKKLTTPHGQRTLQDLHDMAARCGARCTLSEKSEKSDTLMSAPSELKALQSIHDAAIEAGATCRSGGRDTYYYSTTPEEQPPMKADGKSASAVMDTPPTPPAEKQPGLVERIAAKFAALFSDVDADSLPVPTPAVVTPEQTVDVAAQIAALTKQNEELAAQFSALQAEKAHGDAATLVEQAIKDKKIPPHARESYIAMGKDNFASLQAVIAAMPVMFSDTPQEKPPATDRERVEALLSLTPLGRSTLAAQNEREVNPRATFKEAK